jgi:hypothetical protein
MFLARSDFRPGVSATIDGEVGSSDVGRFRAGDERDQCGDLFNATVAAQRCSGFLGRGPGLLIEEDVKI